MLSAEARLTPAPTTRFNRLAHVAAGMLHGVVATACFGLSWSGPIQPPEPLMMVEVVRLAPPAPLPPAPTTAEPPQPPTPPVPPVPKEVPPPPKPMAKATSKPIRKATSTVVPAPTTPVPDRDETVDNNDESDDNSVAPPTSTPISAIPASPGGSGGNAALLVPPNSNAGYLNNPKPPYPPLARRRGLQGVVVLTVAVDAQGRPETVSLRSTSGHPVLDQSAMETVREWRFVPATRGGRPVAATVEIPIRFTLTGAS